MVQKTCPEKLTCITIAISYASLGGMWTFFSDSLFAVLLNESEVSHQSVALSHWLFIAFSALLLYWLLRFWDVAISHSQESLRDVNRALRGFSECTKAITRLTDEQELMREICRIFVKIGGYRFAWVGFAELDEEKTLRPVAQWGYEDNFIDSMNATWADCERGRGPAGTAIRTGETTVFQDFNTNPDYLPWREKALECGYASGISLPLRDGEHPYGALVIFSEQTHVFDKDEIIRMEELANDLSYGIKTIRMNTERERVLEEQVLLAAVIEQASNGVLTFDKDGMIHYANTAYGDICDIEVDKIVGSNIHNTGCFQRNHKFYQGIKRTIATGEVLSGHFINSKKDGSPYEIDAWISPVLSRSNKVLRYVAIVRDVTHEVQLETQLRQAQKLEAIATLSGGIAHDFNNLLAVIITNTEMSLEDAQTDNPLKNSLELVLKAGFRGKSLVRQILTLSRQTDQERQPVRVENIVDECFNLLRATLPTTIEVKRKSSEKLGFVAADPSQIHQVIMNLCTNAADAMQDHGGILSIRMQEIKLDRLAVKNYPGLNPGEFVEITVADSGHGMERNVQERIFDPFFTTKPSGKGTGLGLSVAHGIIKSHGGAITVNSIPEQGTSFTLLLPRIDQQEEPIGLPTKPVGRGGNEHILLVDDEVDYVAGKQKLLERMGYKVSAKYDSRETLNLFRSAPYSFDLVITDQTMPYLSGDMLAREILAIRPDIPIILCSGSSPESNMSITPERAKAVGIREVLLKPVAKDEMNNAVRRLLNEHAAEEMRGDYAEYSYH